MGFVWPEELRTLRLTMINIRISGMMIKRVMSGAIKLYNIRWLRAPISKSARNCRPGLRCRESCRAGLETLSSTLTRLMALTPSSRSHAVLRRCLKL